MIMPEQIETDFFAPCGMNCMVCYVHLKQKKPCGGCLGEDLYKPERCRKCVIKDCVQSRNINYCFQCGEFPCKRIKSLSKSYTTRYGTSLIENSNMVKDSGLTRFLELERIRWLCTCGGVYSIHDHFCSECKSMFS